MVENIKYPPKNKFHVLDGTMYIFSSGMGTCGMSVGYPSTMYHLADDVTMVGNASCNIRFRLLSIDGKQKKLYI